MKRGITILLLGLLILNSIFVLAEEETEIATQDEIAQLEKDTAQTEDPTKTPDKELIREDLEKTTEEFKQISNIGKTPVEIPEWLDAPARIVLGIRSDEEVNGRTLISLFALWIFVLLIIVEVTKFIPMIEGRTKQIIVAIIITTLMGTTRAIQQGFFAWKTMLETINILETSSTLFISATIIIFAIVLFSLKKLSKTLEISGKIAKAKAQGLKAGASAAIASIRK